MTFLKPGSKAQQPEEPQEEEYTYGEVGTDEEEIVVDFSTVGVVPSQGSYLLEVQNAKAKKAKSSGNQMLALTLRILQPEEYMGVFVFDNLMLEGPGLNRTKAAFETIFGSAVERFSVSAVQGKQFWAELEPEHDAQYGDRARISRYGQ